MYVQAAIAAVTSRLDVKKFLEFTTRHIYS